MFSISFILYSNCITFLLCFFKCSLLVLFCIQIASLEEDKKAFGMTQSKETTMLEAKKISCGKSEVDFIVSYYFYGKRDLIW